MQQLIRRVRSGLFWKATVLISACVPSVVMADCTAVLQAGQPKSAFRAPADDVANAIATLTLQIGYTYVVITKNSNSGRSTTSPVDGAMTLCEALTQALRGTSYDFVIKEQERNIVVYSPERQASVVRAKDARKVAQSHKIDEVVITGSHIHGADEAVAPLIQVSQADLNRGSFATVQDALYSLPLNSLSAPREDFNTNGNSGAGAGVNLRSLGVGATLVLVDGYRQPSSGAMGEFTDVSAIPWSVVERVEVYPDGASAQYGSDAVAGVVNIITRRNFAGAETQARVAGAPGGRQELLVSQLVGAKWDAGNLMMAYQFTDATNLPAAARGYAADADKRPYGGNDYRSFLSNPGNILDPNTLLPVYGIPPGQDGRGLEVASLSRRHNRENQLAGSDLFPDRRSHGFYMDGGYRFSDTVELFANAHYSRRDAVSGQGSIRSNLLVPASNPFFVDPFGGSRFLLIDYSFSKDFSPMASSARTIAYGANVEVSIRGRSDWLTRVAASYAREGLDVRRNGLVLSALNEALADPNPLTAFNPFGDGSNTNPATLGKILSVDSFGSLSSVAMLSAIADGPIVHISGGDVRLAVGIERRRETLSPYQSSAGNNIDFVGRYARYVDAAFAELEVPLVGHSGNAKDSVGLSLMLAGRQEWHSDFGSTTNPQVRLVGVPAQSLMLRASWGTSFRSPTLDDIHDTSQNGSGLTTLPDPKSPTGYSVVAAMWGTNAALKPETATTWTAGLDWAPKQMAGFSTSVTYYWIEYRGQITQPALADESDILNNESEWLQVIERNPTRNEVLAFCARPDYIGVRAICNGSNPAAIIDLQLANLTATKTQGVDVDARQTLSWSNGRIAFGLQGSQIIRYDQAGSPSAPFISTLNTLGNPFSRRARGTVDWETDRLLPNALGASLAINYTGAYSHAASTLVSRVAPWLTVDGQLRYNIARAGSWLTGLEFSVNVVNLFNQSPPFVDWVNGYDYYTKQPLGRVVSLLVRARW